MSTETKEKQATTIIEKVVKLWDTEYSKKPGMRPTIEKSEGRKTIDEGGKIISYDDNRFFAKIILPEELPKEIPDYDVYYHFYYNKTRKELYIRLYYETSDFYNVEAFYKFIIESKFPNINNIPLKVERLRLVLDKNLIDEDPKVICDYMKELIGLTQKTVCEYLNENKLETLKKQENTQLSENIVPQAESLFPEYRVKRIDLLLENKNDKSLHKLELKI